MNKAISILAPFFLLGFWGSILIDDHKYDGENHLANIKMLTDQGENAEAYLSFDETMLIYQSSSGEIECDQIFIMNVDGSDKRLGKKSKASSLGSSPFWRTDRN